jgi:hypothetical protein
MSLTTKNIFSYIQRKTLKPTTYNAGVTVVLNSEDIGLAPGGVWSRDLQSTRSNLWNDGYSIITHNTLLTFQMSQICWLAYMHTY